ncbi:NAD(P)/FAD-dependent oxidoreductase [Rhodococcus sp. T2V]|uniref:flavin-containing monooxygenase n=1 Tax=Rhodococcus sp. T2V TaxID=3034164 RepID=UPI0023E10342|nr:NAD(P)/FAD-dependent oxidoreductase [Rhodococcus sp. T2V]MDF3309650.1 NAD(P)/FAD-dependent oxidoreductase [Rhodococcus sp. T2V]
MTQLTGPKSVDAIIIGAGFAGMYALKRLRDDLELSVVAFETASDVGGTWYWNRYPGARCDAESIFYSYSFDPELDQDWTWTERYAAQPDILAYAQRVADRHDLRRDIRFSTTVVAAAWDSTSHIWTVELDSGEHVTARFLIGAAGCLSAVQIPDIDGIEDFAGEVYHTGRWPHEGVDLAGKHVVVIGTGSSGVQLIPVIAEEAASVTVLQRTPNFTIPARNRDYTDEELETTKRTYPILRAESRETFGGAILVPPPGKAFDLTEDERKASLDARWVEGGGAFMFAFEDSLSDLEANEVAADYVRERIRDTVTDSAAAEQLTSMEFPLGTKRLCIGTDYYEAFNRDNVHLVGLRQHPIQRVVPNGVELDGPTVEADVIVFATGYDAITGPLSRIDIRGKDGATLRDKWQQAANAYLGVAVAGFPNLFIITGPGSPSVLTNMISAIEQHVDWIVDYVGQMCSNGVRSTVADATAEQEWMDHVAELAGTTLFPHAASWYTGANVPGKPAAFLPYVAGIPTFRDVCDGVAKDGYRGFIEQR